VTRVFARTQFVRQSFGFDRQTNIGRLAVPPDSVTDVGVPMQVGRLSGGSVAPQSTGVAV